MPLRVGQRARSPSSPTSGASVLLNLRADLRLSPGVGWLLAASVGGELVVEGRLALELGGWVSTLPGRLRAGLSRGIGPVPLGLSGLAGLAVPLRHLAQLGQPVATRLALNAECLVWPGPCLFLPEPSPGRGGAELPEGLWACARARFRSTGPWATARGGVVLAQLGGVDALLSGGGGQGAHRGAVEPVDEPVEHGGQPGVEVALGAGVGLGDPGPHAVGVVLGARPQLGAPVGVALTARLGRHPGQGVGDVAGGVGHREARRGQHRVPDGEVLVLRRQPRRVDLAAFAVRAGASAMSGASPRHARAEASGPWCRSSIAATASWAVNVSGRVGGQRRHRVAAAGVGIAVDEIALLGVRVRIVGVRAVKQVAAPEPGLVSISTTRLPGSPTGMPAPAR